jgi:hypothetical protein
VVFSGHIENFFMTSASVSWEGSTSTEVLQAKCFRNMLESSEISSLVYVPCRIISDILVLELKSMKRRSGSSVKGVPWACPNCFLFRCRRYWVISAGVSTVVQSLHFLGSSSGLVGIRREERPGCQVQSLRTNLSLRYILLIFRLS